MSLTCALALRADGPQQDDVVQHMRYDLLSLVGYDPVVTRHLSPDELSHLTWSSALSVVSALLFACSGAYLVYLGVNAGRLLPVVVAVSFLVVFLFALNMQRMFITSGGFGYHGSATAGLSWRPDSLRLVGVVFLALLFAQPLLLLLRHSEIESTLQDRIKAVTSLYRSKQLAKLDHERDGLLQRSATLDEKLQLLGVTPPIAPEAGSGTTAIATPAHRKAFVIGIQHYQHLAAPAVTDAPAEIARTLTGMGYQITRANDLAYDDLLVAIDRYLKGLQPGDISVVYYAGYAGTGPAQARLLPADFAPDKAGATIKLAQLMDDIAATSPRASVLLLDNIRLPSDPTPAPSTQSAPPPNTILVTAWSSPAPRQRHRTSSVFAQALTHQLVRGAAVDTVLHAVSDEVLAAGQPAQKDAQPVSISSSLGKAYLQLSGSVPATHLSLTDVASGLEGMCAQNATVTMDAAKTCLRDAKRLLDTQLAEIERQRHDGVERKVGAYRNSILRSGMVRERWQILWSNPWTNAAFMLVCVLVMTLGDAVRDLRPEALRRYELERTRLARAAVEHVFTNAKEHVRGALAGLPSGPLPGPRWHELRSYFDRGVAATPVRVPPFEPHGTADDLLDRLAWQAQQVEET